MQDFDRRTGLLGYGHVPKVGPVDTRSVIPVS